MNLIRVMIIPEVEERKGPRRQKIHTQGTEGSDFGGNSCGGKDKFGRNI